MPNNAKIQRLVREELGGFSIRTCLVNVLTALLPVDACSRVRAPLWRLAGVSVGKGTTMTGRIRLTGSRRAARNLRIGALCYLNDDITFNAGERVTLGDGVSVGMRCLFITATHEIGDASFRAGTRSFRPIAVGSGCWLAAGVTVLPGVTVGEGTVVGAGALVAKDLPANVLAAGTPARVVRSLTTESQ